MNTLSCTKNNYFDQLFDLWNSSFQDESFWEAQYVQIENELDPFRAEALLNLGSKITSVNGAKSKVLAIFLQLFSEAFMGPEDDTLHIFFDQNNLAQTALKVEEFAIRANSLLFIKAVFRKSYFANSIILSGVVAKAPIKNTLNLSSIGLTLIPTDLFTSIPENVSSINLSNNLLHTIPEEIEDFDNLSSLDLSNNPLLTKLPFSIANLPDDCSINLSGTPILKHFSDFLVKGKITVRSIKVFFKQYENLYKQIVINHYTVKAQQGEICPLDIHYYTQIQLSQYKTATHFSQ